MPQWTKLPSAGTERTLWQFVAIEVVLLAGHMLGSWLTYGSVLGFEPTWLRAFREHQDPANPLGVRNVEIFVRDITGLGGIGILILVVTVSFFAFGFANRWRDGLILVATALSAITVIEIFKWISPRGRPQIVPHLVTEINASFPSGHAAMSTVIYLMLAVLLLQTVRDLRLRRLIWTITIALPVAIGLSRLYLGVHWPTDIMGGWIFGTLWVIASARMFTLR
jgi:undecaprenyl-diphosphatase